MPYPRAHFYLRLRSDTLHRDAHSTDFLSSTGRCVWGDHLDRSKLTRRFRNALLASLLLSAVTVTGSAQVTNDIVSLAQTGDSITWQVLLPINISGLTLDVVGPEPTTPGANRYTSRQAFGPSDPIQFSTSGLGPGVYQWQITLSPEVPQSFKDRQAAVRELSLAGQQAFLDEMRAAGAIPEEDQPLSEGGDFTIAAAGVIVPTDPSDPTQPDDLCPNTAPGELENGAGCSINDLCPCAGPKDTGWNWTGPGEYQACVEGASQGLVDEGLMTAAEQAQALADAAASECGDQCPGTAPGEAEDATGCSVNDLCPCGGVDGVPWANHGGYVSCVDDTSDFFVFKGVITDEEKGKIVSSAAKSTCGKKPKPGKGPKNK